MVFKQLLIAIAVAFLVNEVEGLSVMLMENKPYCFLKEVAKNNDIVVNYVVTGLNEDLIEF